MLDDYMVEQETAYNIMMNAINEDRVSHAYLIDENNNSSSFDIVMAFVKEIVCSKLADEEKEILCKRIDDNNYPEVKIISPDGMLIRKQQILDLQQEFSMAAVEGSKRIYVIRDADKMRSETANSMLKFLEEPDNSIIAILMTNNFNNLLSTIVSRCQIIRLNNNNSIDVNEELSLLALNFIKNIEDSGYYAVMKEQEILFDTIGVKEREKYVYFFDKLIDMYYDILKILNGDKNIQYVDYLEKFDKISKNNTHEGVLRKISLLIGYKDRIKYNVNINLLIDSLIVNIGGIYEGSWS